MIIALRYDPHTIWLWLTVCHGKIDPFFSSVNHLWKIHPFLRTVSHLFRLGPSKNHGELLVITRLGKCPRCPRCPCPKVSLSSSIVQIDSSLVFDTYCQVLIWDTLDLWWTLCRVGRRWNSLEYCWKTKVERTRIAWAIGSSALSFVVFRSFPSLNQRIIRAHPSDVGAVGASQLRSFASPRSGRDYYVWPLDDSQDAAARTPLHAVQPRRCPCNNAATPWGRNEGALLRRVCLSSPWHEFWAQEYQCLEKLRKQRMLNAEESYDFPPSNIRMLYDAFVCGNFVRHGQTTSLLSKAQGQSCRLGQFSWVFRSFLLQFAASDLATRIATSIAFPGVAALGFCCGRQHPGLDFWQISAKFRYQTDTKFRYQIAIFMPFEAFVDVSVNFAGEHSLWLAIGERRRIWTWGQSAEWIQWDHLSRSWIWRQVVNTELKGVNLDDWNFEALYEKHIFMESLMLELLDDMQTWYYLVCQVQGSSRNWGITHFDNVNCSVFWPSEVQKKEQNRNWEETVDGQVAASFLVVFQSVTLDCASRKQCGIVQALYKL